MYFLYKTLYRLKKEEEKKEVYSTFIQRSIHKLICSNALLT